jgi:hypothetical protein
LGKLQGIDENRHHDMIGLSRRLPNQLQMSLMQIAHCRHQTDPLALVAQPCNMGADRVLCFTDFHHWAL